MLHNYTAGEREVLAREDVLAGVRGGGDERERLRRRGGWLLVAGGGYLRRVMTS